MNSSEAERHSERAKQLWEAGQEHDAVAAWREALAADPDSVQALIALAWALGQVGQAAEGMCLAARAVEIAPDDAAAHRALGELCFVEGRYEEAVGHYMASLERNADASPSLAAELRRDVGDALYMLARFEEAVAQYEGALSVGGDDAYCRLWLGWARYHLGDREGAAAGFDRAHELAPEWHEPLYGQGYLRCGDGEFEGARRCLEEALLVYPEEDELGRAAATCELGNAFRGLGDLTRAAQLYQQALSLDPTHAVARFNLGLAYNELGDYDKASAAFEVAAQLDPEDGEVQTERGRACLELGRHEEAVEAYRAALRINPSDADALSGLGLAYYWLGLYDQSAEQYRSAAQLSPSDPQPRYNLAVALEAAGRHADADEAMEQAWELAQEDADLCVEMARALTSYGRDVEAAVRAARRACVLDPESAEAHNALGTALLSAGQAQAALGPAREAVRLMPEVADYVYDLGMIEEAVGDRREARARFLRALELDPGFEEAQEALRRLEDEG